jgi:peptidoglycan/xylan/chitin deacetylase (PgdA/CDA1 family)
MVRLCIGLIALGLLLAAYTTRAASNLNVLQGNEDALKNNIIITIDDCSIEQNVRTIFNMLHKRGLTATFFPAMKWIKNQDKQLWRDIAAAGFDIGYHTRQHKLVMSRAELDQDFPLFQQELRDILGDPNYTIQYVRPPGGNWNKTWMDWASANNLITVKWDATLPAILLRGFEDILANHKRGGTILLLHTGQAEIKWLEKNLDTLTRLKDSDGQPYKIESLSAALAD